MNAEARLYRGDRVRVACVPGEEDLPPQPIWELMCDGYDADDLTNPGLAEELRGTGMWSLHIRYVTPGTCDNSAVGDTAFMLVRMSDLEYVARAANPDTSCPGECA